MYRLISSLKVSLLIAMLIVTQFAVAQSNRQTTLAVADNIYSFSVNGEYISLFIVTDDGVMVFDPINTPHAEAMVKEIKKITNKPIKYVLHSHNHWDHAGGGQVFINEGAMTLAHEEATAWMKANPNRDMIPPTKSWTGSRADIQLGGTTVELHYLGMNHGLGMTVFVLPQSRVAYIADIVTPNRVIFSVVPDFNIREWERSLSEILELEFDTAVFSHNEADTPLAGGTKEDVVQQLEYIQDLRDGFYAELQKGTNPFMIPTMLTLPKYKHWVGYDDWLEMNVWRILTDEFMGPYPWRAEPANNQ
ncbi:MBL fold metallo-hydrolase [Shewanella sp. VB17]|uniref:MBL fold metallo-hydrolase n=1 Tax=Shewanella sp. VB17 TaxID=2739432 RepID=UPI0015666E3D|nr:MBL fold metallo-hydrolase [Shewanella sp. VB17]NRD75796.1 MBL fold metallo-hydrolase [Shewanella sp. VB17]